MKQISSENEPNNFTISDLETNDFFSLVIYFTIYMDDLENPTITFVTEPNLIDQIEGTRHKAKIPIYPCGKTWDYILLSSFINEFDDFKKASRRFFLTEDPQSAIFKFMFVHKLKQKHKFWVEICNQISVFGSADWIITDWNLDSSEFFSTLRSQNRVRKKPKLQTHYYFSYKISKLSSGTIAMLKNIPVLYTGIFDYSDAFHSFAKKIVTKANLLYNDETKFIHDYYNFFILPQKNEVHCLESLKKKVKGYFQLNVINITKRRRLTKIAHDKKEFHVLNGIYISNHAKSLLVNNDVVSRLLVDTTWKLMPNYVTSILMASVHNIGIPISFAFGIGETKSLYNLHIDTFKEKFDIDLCRYVIESDQGTAIEGVCKERNIEHIYCLRHFLVSLKYNEFSHAVGILLKCVSKTDFESEKKHFHEQFKDIKDKEKIRKLKKILNKVGLKFTKNEIKEKDSDLWRRCSMLHRSDYEMPSTTNSLESTHGHLNKKIPRNNEFWASIHRLAQGLTINNEEINKKIRHNYNSVKHKTILKLKSTKIENMTAQKKFYDTTIDHCNCSDNKLVSKMMKIDIPCHHRLSSGATFPECPTLRLSLEDEFDFLDDSIKPSTEEEEELNETEEFYRNKQYAIKLIKRYSHFKDTEKIEQFVNFSYCSENDSAFILGKPVSLIQLIDEGISYFTDMRDKTKKLKKKAALNESDDDD